MSSTAQDIVLQVVRDKPGISVAEINSIVGFDSQRKVGSLFRNGIVSREKVNLSGKYLYYPMVMK